MKPKILVKKILLLCLISMAIVYGNLVDETSSGKSGTAVAAGGAKIAKAGAAGTISKGAGASAVGAKGFAKKGGIAAGAAGAAGFKKGGAAKGEAALKKFGKSGFKKGAVKKVFGMGHDKKFAKIIYGHHKAFKFATVAGAGASGGKMGGMEAKKDFAKAGKMEGFKKGTKGIKKGFATAGGAKGAIKKGAFVKGAFKKGSLAGAKGFQKAANVGADIG